MPATRTSSSSSRRVARTGRATAVTVVATSRFEVNTHLQTGRSSAELSRQPYSTVQYSTVQYSTVQYTHMSQLFTAIVD
jgi:hypothetical protein